jgi:ABC-type nitrate/sulfonate/bicarbonate transport system permease component
MIQSYMHYNKYIGPALLLLVWSVVVHLHVASQTLLPSMFDTLMKIYYLIVSGDIFKDLYATIGRALIGVTIASLTGVFFGLLLAVHKKIYSMFEVLIDFFRSLPATAMFPLFLLAFGIGNGSKIAMAWFISFWVVLVNTIYGVNQGSRIRLKVAQSFKATKFQTFKKVICMDALPQIIIGVRVSISLSLIAVVVSEMFIGSNTGLGQKIYDSYLTYEISSLYAWLIITGCSGYVLNRICFTWEKKLIHWVGR